MQDKDGKLIWLNHHNVEDFLLPGDKKQLEDWMKRHNIKEPTVFTVMCWRCKREVRVPFKYFKKTAETLKNAEMRVYHPYGTDTYFYECVAECKMKGA